MTRFPCPNNTTPTAPLRWRALLTALAATLATTAPLTAQGVSTAGLRGRVLDQAEAGIEGALVTLEHTETGATNTALTTADGRYTLRNLRPGGPYTMTVTRIGFGDQMREELELLLGRFINLDITLLPEAVAIEGIEVEARRDIEFDPGRIGISTL
ncbi:MAG: carboxypeptidase-like regulatory domain-containing protein, partial [Gemmatimonadota bacterium]|nr:carboxypeptidase-like regulatory domain-containing protein [Gemmatimonadota bacterium]